MTNKTNQYREAIKEYKALIKKHYNINMSHEEAKKQSMELLELFNMVPSTVSEATTL